MMNFGQALRVLKGGRKVARVGWNGKGLYVYYVPANVYPSQTQVAKEEFGEMVPYAAYLALVNRYPDGLPYVNTWAPSVSDVLAEDWVEVGA